jgi:pimeloyl-ACP methyl ester carboxylesterase
VIWPRTAVSLPFALALLCGCSAAELQQRQTRAEDLAGGHGWQARTIATDTFALAAWFGPQQNEEGAFSGALTIYIEGDGFAWASRSRPSANPTPRRPLALELALLHPRGKGNVAYLARPCQFVWESDLRGCTRAVWTHQRFSEAAVEASDQAIDRLKADYRAERLTLVGYSGGGAIAALVAARRDDVVRLVTIAGVLDHALWTDSKRLSPLTDSLNPADAWAALTEVTQIHYVGSTDEVINVTLAESFRARFSNPEHIEIVVLEDFDHRCCWTDAWPRLAASWSVE